MNYLSIRNILLNIIQYIDKEKRIILLSFILNIKDFKYAIKAGWISNEIKILLDNCYEENIGKYYFIALLKSIIFDSSEQFKNLIKYSIINDRKDIADYILLKNPIYKSAKSNKKKLYLDNIDKLYEIVIISLYEIVIIKKCNDYKYFFNIIKKLYNIADGYKLFEEIICHLSYINCLIGYPHGIDYAICIAQVIVDLESSYNIKIEDKYKIISIMLKDDYTGDPLPRKTQFTFRSINLFRYILNINCDQDRNIHNLNRAINRYNININTISKNDLSFFMKIMYKTRIYDYFITKMGGMGKILDRLTET